MERDMILDNLRFACRNLRTAPGFTVTAVLSLALGIGATLAMFTVVNSILLKPLSFRNPDRLVFITQTGTTMPSINPFVGIAPHSSCAGATRFDRSSRSP
jgi:hypothetical protein